MLTLSEELGGGGVEGLIWLLILLFCRGGGGRKLGGFWLVGRMLVPLSLVLFQI